MTERPTGPARAALDGDEGLDDFDARLTTFLRARSESSAGLPGVAEMTLRLAGPRIARRRFVTSRAVWVALALAALVVVGLVLGSGASPRLTAVVPPPATSSPTPFVRPTIPAPSIDPTPCTSGRIALSRPTGGSLPAAASGLRAPAGMRIAAVFPDVSEDQAVSGAVVVADSAIGSGRMIARYDAPASEGNTFVEVVGMDAGGDRIVLRATHQGMTKRTFGADCSDLYVAAADGSSLARLTDNGPGKTANAIAISATGRAIAYVQAEQDQSAVNPIATWTLRTIGADGSAANVDFATCPFPPPYLSWAPDERRLAFVCDRFVGIVDLAARSMVVTPFDDDRGRTPMSVAWIDATHLTLALADDGPGLGSGPLLVQSLDISGGSVRRTLRSTTDEKTEWVEGNPVFSPDRAWLLAQGDGNIDPGLGEFPTFLINARTGATTRLPWPVAGSKYQDPVWLPGSGLNVLAVDQQRLYLVDLIGRKRQDLGAIPSESFAITAFGA